MKKRILAICVHNSARSQMVEAFINAYFGDKYEAFSAGIKPGELNKFVVEAMKEIGIDISGNKTKSVSEFKGQRFDYVVTVCDEAREACPYFPGGVQYIHNSFEDPSSFSGSYEEILRQVRKVRDEIKEWVANTFGSEGKINETNIPSF